MIVENCPAAKESLIQAVGAPDHWCPVYAQKTSSIDIKCHWSYLTRSLGGEKEINGTFLFSTSSDLCTTACERLGQSSNKREDYCPGTELMNAVRECSEAAADVHLPEGWCPAASLGLVEAAAVPEEKSVGHSWTTTFQAEYQAISSVQEHREQAVGFLQQPVSLAGMDAWNHAQCEPAFNQRCWEKGRFEDCCTDCAEVEVHDKCWWSYDSSMGHLNGSFLVDASPMGEPCFQACAAINSEDWSWSDMCVDGGLIYEHISVGACTKAADSVKAAVRASSNYTTFCGHGPVRNSPDR